MAANAGVATASIVLERAAGVELLGELQDSGYEHPTFLARRADGQTLQLTELLYRTLESIDGGRDLDAVAGLLSERIGKRATSDDVRYLVEEKLRPLGLLKKPDGGEPAVRKANPLLALRARVVLSDERLTRRITAPFAVLFWPPVVVAVVVAFAVMTGWLLFTHGLAGSTRAMLYNPAMVAVLLGLTVVSAGFHEFGHAAACRYGGAQPGAMGAGLYLVWPAFYTDVTDSYRLDRRGRLRTDLGGLYFNMVFALSAFAAWAATGWEALLVVIPLQLLQMLHQLLPVVRLDGYLILADLTGVPDLFARIKPTLRSVLPWVRADESVSALKPWVRVVVTAWVVVVIPALAFGLLALAFGLPRFLATTWDSAGRQWDRVTAADGDVLAVMVGLLGIAVLALPALSSAYLFARIARRAAASRAGRVGLVAAAAALAWLWWPNGEYEPIHRDERGTVFDTVRAVRSLPSGRPGLTASREAELVQPTTTTTSTTSTSVAPSSTTSSVTSTTLEPSTTTSSTSTTSTSTTAPTTSTTTSTTTTEEADP